MDPRASLSCKQGIVGGIEDSRASGQGGADLNDVVTEATQNTSVTLSAVVDSTANPAEYHID
jgi:hypothetical protein